MKDQALTSYFQRQMRDLLRQREQDADPPWDKLARPEPTDEEILQILSAWAASDQWAPPGFALTTPFELLASLSETDRATICDEFRRLLKSAGQYH